MLDQGRELSDMSMVMATIIIILLVGIAVELCVFAPIERRCCATAGCSAPETRQPLPPATPTGTGPVGRLPPATAGHGRVSAQVDALIRLSILGCGPETPRVAWNLHDPERIQRIGLTRTKCPFGPTAGRRRAYTGEYEEHSCCRGAVGTFALLGMLAPVRAPPPLPTPTRR